MAGGRRAGFLTARLWYSPNELTHFRVANKALATVAQFYPVNKRQLGITAYVRAAHHTLTPPAVEDH